MPPRPARSLVIAPQWIGDAVMSQPLLARLAARGERIAVAALPWVAPVYRAMPGEVAEVIELPFAHGRLDWPARWRIAGRLRGRFDAGYVLPNSIKSALLPWLAGVPLRVGYQGEGRPLLLNRRLPNPAGRPPMVTFYRALAGAVAVPGSSAASTAGARSDRTSGEAVDPSATERPRLSLPTERLREACAQVGVEPHRFWVFAPGAEYGPAKRWPAAHYAALAGALHADRGDGPVLLLGSAKERGLCGEIAAGAPPGSCRVLAGQLPLDDAMALIAMARGVVSNDSGLMHVAAAFGVPQVAVFGSTSPEHTPPLNPRARVVWLKDELKARFGLGCVPCFERSCRYGHTLCLAEAAPSRVLAALRDAMTATDTAPAADQGASVPT